MTIPAVQKTLLLCLLLLLVLMTRQCLARMEAAVILPHGDFAYDPLLVDEPAERRAATRIATASRRVGHHFLHQTINPDIIFLITPHGIALTHDFGLYLGQKAWGYADIGVDLHHRPNATKPYRVTLPTPIPLAPTLVQDLLDKYMVGMNVTGIKTSADESQPMNLQWAEVIPLLLVNASKHHTTTRCNSTRQYIIWSQPLRRFGDFEGADMVEELIRLGQAIFDWMEQRPERFAVLVSADLSHTHRADGPYGYAAASQRFDDYIHKWARYDPCHDARALLEHATALQPQALSCGYTGMVLLHGMLCGAGTSTGDLTTSVPPQMMTKRHGNTWISRVLVDKNVTYYGMMAAMFRRVDQDVMQPS